MWITSSLINSGFQWRNSVSDAILNMHSYNSWDTKMCFMLYKIGILFILQTCVNLGIDRIVPVLLKLLDIKFYICKMVASCEDLFHHAVLSKGI